MKIGIYTPIGDLTKYGYQYYYKIVLNNLQKFSDEVLLISTTRSNKVGDFKDFPKITFISNKNTWFETLDNKEVFSFDRQCQNQVTAFNYFKNNNFDAYFIVHINQYIPESSFLGLRKICKEMIKKKKPFEWLYKKNQLKNIIFNAHCRLPWILNLKIKNPYRITPDSLTNQKNGKVFKIQSGNFKKFNNIAIVDPIGEFTFNDLEQKHNFIIHELSKLNNQADLIFKRENYLKFAIEKLKSKIISKEELSTTGKKILNNSKKRFICS